MSAQTALADTVDGGAYVLLPEPAPEPAQRKLSRGAEWYGHWQLLSGTATAGLYSLAVWATYESRDPDTVIATIGSAYLFSGYAATGAFIHLEHDNGVAAVISLVSRATLGVAAPVIASLVCKDPADCGEVVAATTTAATMAPVLVDGFALAWD